MLSRVFSLELYVAIDQFWQKPFLKKINNVVAIDSHLFNIYEVCGSVSYDTVEVGSSNSAHAGATSPAALDVYDPQSLFSSLSHSSISP